MKKIIFASAMIGCASVVPSAIAQNPSAAQQADSWRLRELVPTANTSSNAAPEFYSGETSDVGPQTLLQMKRHHPMLEASADAQIFYTDNMFLANSVKQSADVIVSTARVALAPTAEVADGQLTPRIGYQHQWFSYGVFGDDQVQVAKFKPVFPPRLTSIDAFDFNVMTVFSDVTWRWHNWDFSAGVDYRRFMDSDDYNEFYHEIAPRWAAHYTFQFTENKSIMIGYEGDYRFTETQNPIFLEKDNYNDRTDHSFVLVGNWRLCSHAIVQPFYRLQYSNFTHIRSGREDWLNSFGIALQLPFTQNIALRAFVSYDTLHTDNSYYQNYDKLDAGGGLNLTVRF